MEPKVNYIVVGAFVLLLGFTVLGAIFWLGKTDYRGIYDRYDVYTRESVAGLSVDSTVKYRGVDVGRVKEVVLNPENPEEVRITLNIVGGTPVKTDTQAVLVTQGLTGLVTLNLTGGTREAPHRPWTSPLPWHCRPFGVTSGEGPGASLPQGQTATTRNATSRKPP